MTNIGPLIVNYKWKFISEADNIIMNQKSEDFNVRTNSRENLYDIDINNTNSSTPMIDNDTSLQPVDSFQKNNKQADIYLPGIEEIFDISPLFGSLHPGECQILKISYYGHKEIKAHAKLICEVKNGPNYELLLKGEASVLNYEISDYSIHFDYIVSIKFFNLINFVILIYF
jgi:hypothetical protein